MTKKKKDEKEDGRKVGAVGRSVWMTRLLRVEA